MTNNKTGSYAVTTKISWKKKNKPRVSGKNKKNARNVIYPIFEKCANLTEDEFWISVFNECARGKFPRSFYFKNNLITYRKGNKTKRLQIPTSPASAFNMILEFFQQEGGLLSKLDRKKRKKETEEMLQCVKYKSWSEIKTEKIKEIVVIEFVEQLCKKHNFNLEQKKELITTIKKGFLLKYFTNSNIYMNDGRIVDIDGLLYNKYDNIYELDEDYKSKKIGRKIKGLGIEEDKNQITIDFMERWIKYIDNLEENRVKKIKNYSSSWSTTNSSEEMSLSKSFSLPTNLTTISTTS